MAVTVTVPLVFSVKPDRVEEFKSMLRDRLPDTGPMRAALGWTFLKTWTILATSTWWKTGNQRCTKKSTRPGGTSPESSMSWDRSSPASQGSTTSTSRISRRSLNSRMTGWVRRGRFLTCPAPERPIPPDESETAPCCNVVPIFEGWST